MDKKHAETVKILEKQQVQELSIIRLGEPVQLAAEKDAAKRSSDASAEALENPTPSSLATDLTHYKVRLFLISD